MRGCFAGNTQASRKYLLKSDPFTIPFHHEDFEVEKVYLHPEKTSKQRVAVFIRLPPLFVMVWTSFSPLYLFNYGAEASKDYSFVRCRSQYGIPAYGMTTVRYLQTGEA